jgi:hypothetical protein
MLDGEGGVPRSERLFVLRIWREDGIPAEQMRGSVLEVGTDRRFYFTELSDLGAYLDSRLNAPGADA